MIVLAYRCSNGQCRLERVSLATAALMEVAGDSNGPKLQLACLSTSSFAVAGEDKPDNARPDPCSYRLGPWSKWLQPMTT